jgi:hypothetical protein
MAKFDNPLKNLKVASPCSSNWDGMYGDEKVRFCGECKLNVYNLSGMTKLEAEKLLLNTEGRLCVRYYTRADGSVITQDCPVGWRAFKKRVSNLAAAACSLVLGIFAIFMFIAPARENVTVGTLEVLHTPTPTPVSTPSPYMTMGAVAPRKPNVVMGDVAAPRKEKDGADDQKMIEDAVRKLSQKKS